MAMCGRMVVVYFCFAVLGIRASELYPQLLAIFVCFDSVFFEIMSPVEETGFKFPI